MRSFLTLLRRSYINLELFQRALLIAWLVVILSLPLLAAFWSMQSVQQGLALVVLLQGVFVIHVLYRSWGWWTMLRTSLEVLFFVWVVLAILIRSGLPYGNLQYATYQPMILGVPIAIPLSWLMMLPSAWAISRLITRKLGGCLLRLVFVVVSGMAFTAWALYFEPLLVHLGLVRWNPPGQFFGTPWLHFLGVFLLAGLVTFTISPKRLQSGPLVYIYLLTWLASLIYMVTIKGLFWSSLAGFLAMGIFLILAIVGTEGAK